MVDLSLNVTFDRDWTLTSVVPAGAAVIAFDQWGDGEVDDIEVELDAPPA